MATDPTPDKPARKRSTDPTPDAPTKARKKPWDMNDDDFDDMARTSIDKSIHRHTGETKRFKEGEGVEDVVDDSALDD
jgi:hypothetical protein